MNDYSDPVKAYRSYAKLAEENHENANKWRARVQSAVKALAARLEHVPHDLDIYDLADADVRMIQTQLGNLRVCVTSRDRQRQERDKAAAAWREAEGLEGDEEPL